MNLSLQISSETKEEKIIDEEKKHHLTQKIALLNIIQEIITRVSNKGSAIKIASVTTAFAIIALLDKKNSDLIALSSPLAIIFFWFFHAYYLNLERGFISLYNESAEISFPEKVDFKIDIKKLNAMKEPYFKTFLKTNLILFHLPILIFILLNIIIEKEPKCLQGLV